MRKFKGFNTVEVEFGNFKIYDIDLAKRDLLNELYTQKGERLMSPAYGSIIWQVLFDPVYDTTIQIIKDDCARIVGKDPRLELLETVVEEDIDDHRLTVKLVLRYIPTASITELIAVYDRYMAIERTQG